MGIYIHGMKMPKDGEFVFIAQDGTAYKYERGDVVTYGDAYNETASAAELPPHGRLIDAGATLLEAMRCSGPVTGDGWSNWGVYALIERQPTIIPADPEKEDT